MELGEDQEVVEWFWYTSWRPGLYGYNSKQRKRGSVAVVLFCLNWARCYYVPRHANSTYISHPIAGVSRHWFWPSDWCNLSLGCRGIFELYGLTPNNGMCCQNAHDAGFMIRPRTAWNLCLVFVARLSLSHKSDPREEIAPRRGAKG
jgi:hypothetical protein